MTKILVPLDGTPFSAAALPVAETPVQERTDESRLASLTQEQRDRFRGLVVHEGRIPAAIRRAASLTPPTTSGST